jgi:hypothetical protein
VSIHQSETIETNGVVVEGSAGVLLIDPGLSAAEMACLANDLSGSGRTVVAGFSTHPIGITCSGTPSSAEAPRFGTARCAATIHDLVSDTGWEADLAESLPPVDRR